MDDSRPVRARVDDDEDGRVDRWEYYDTTGSIAAVSGGGAGQPRRP